MEVVVSIFRVWAVYEGTLLEFLRPRRRRHIRVHYRYTLCRIPQDLYLHQYRCENLKCPVITCVRNDPLTCAARSCSISRHFVHLTANLWNESNRQFKQMVEFSWSVMAHGDAREGKWRGNWRRDWVTSTLHTTSEHGISSTTTADAHTSAVSSRVNWCPRRFKWTRPFRRKTKSGFCACAITFQTQSTYVCTHCISSVLTAFGLPPLGLRQLSCVLRC
jgi:hypothetical protein